MHPLLTAAAGVYIFYRNVSHVNLCMIPSVAGCNFITCFFCFQQGLTTPKTFRLNYDCITKSISHTFKDICVFCKGKLSVKYVYFPFEYKHLFIIYQAFSHVPNELQVHSCHFKRCIRYIFQLTLTI